MDQPTDPFAVPAFPSGLPAAIPYEPDNHAAADTFIPKALRHPKDPIWETLLSNRYVVSTESALRKIQENLHAEFTKRRAQVNVTRGGRSLSYDDFQQLLTEYEQWKIDARYFQEIVQGKLIIAKRLARDIRREMRLDLYNDTLLAVARAIDRHRNDIAAQGREPCAADRMLWARLDTISWPSTHRSITIAEVLIARGVQPSE